MRRPFHPWGNTRTDIIPSLETAKLKARPPLHREVAELLSERIIFRIDAAAVKLQEIIRRDGLVGALKDDCGIGPENDLVTLITGAYAKVGH